MNATDLPTQLSGPGTDVIARLRERVANGKGAQRRLAQLILSDINLAAHGSIAMLAEQAEVSQPSVTRLARAMGFAGTQDMRNNLVQALAIGGAYLRPQESPEEARESDDVVTFISASAHRALDLFGVGLGAFSFDEVGRCLAQAGTILTCGTGGGSTMAATEMANRLFRFGLHVTCQVDPQLQRMHAALLKPGDVIVGFSISGQARSVVDAVTLARQYGATAICLTRPDSTLAERADHLVPLTTHEDEVILKPTSARFALLAGTDMIAYAAAKQMPGDVVETLRRVRQSILSYPDHPIGD